MAPLSVRAEDALTGENQILVEEDETVSEEDIKSDSEQATADNLETLSDPESGSQEAEKIDIGTDKNIELSFEDDPNYIVGNNERLYCTGSTIKPIVKLYYWKDVTDEIYDNLPDDEKKEVEGKKYQRIVVPASDYEVDYHHVGKLINKNYYIDINAKETSEKYTGKLPVCYQLVEKTHKWGDWTTTIGSTVFKTGERQRTCSICKMVDKQTVAKKTPTVKLNMTTIRLKRKQSTTKFKVSGLATGDYVTSYKSSNKKIFTVSSKGKITAKNKSGTAKLTVTLASGKKATAKVKVQKSTVKTTSLSVNTSSLVLLKSGKYTLRTSKAPLTSGQKTTFKSSNKKIATVSSSGVITAKKKGTVKITIQSGSKKRTCKVQVIEKKFPKGDTNAFLLSCQKIANIIMTDGNWIYYSGPGMKKSFAEARDYIPRQTSCANFVNLCMQEFGTLKPGMAFYSDGNANLVYQGSTSLKKETKELVEKNYDIIYTGGKKALKAGLQPGDICLYKGHTNVYAGLNSDGVPMWYDAGRNSTSDKKPESGYFTNMYRASTFNSMPIYIILRLKKN